MNKFTLQSRSGNGVLAIFMLAVTLILSGCLPGDGATGGPGQIGPVTPPSSTQGQLSLTITSAVVEDGRPVVEFTLLDGDGSPITDQTTFSFTFAKLAPRARYGNGFDWVNYITRARDVSTFNASLMPNGKPMFGNAIQGANENNGTLENLGGGNYRYTYALDLSNGSVTRTIAAVPGAGEQPLEELYRCVENGSHTVHSFDASLGTVDRCTWADGTTLPRGVSITPIDENSFDYTVEYNPTWTHRVGMQLGGAATGRVANAWFDFIPDTGEQVEHGVHATRSIVDLESCNSCHGGTLAKHGGGRVNPNYCVTCHNPGSVDPVSGRSIDFKQMIHKVHRGASLPSVAAGVPYFIRGNDFSNLRFPQAVHENGGVAEAGNYARQGVLANGNPIPRTFSYGIDNCVKCHIDQSLQDELEVAAGGPEALAKQQLAKVTPDGGNWYSIRTVEACGSCHDNVYWYNGDGVDDDRLPAMMAELFDANTDGYRGDWRSGHRAGANCDGGTGLNCTGGTWTWRAHPDTTSTTFGEHHEGASLFNTGNACGGCHNPTIAGDADNLGKRGVGQTGNARVHMTRAHLGFLAAGIRQDQLRMEFGAEGATLDPVAETISFRLRVRDLGNVNGSTLNHDTNATFALGFVLGWMDEGYADFTHSNNPNGPGRTLDISCNATCWTDNGAGNVTSITGPSAGYYTVTLDVSSIMGNMPDNGVGTVAVQGAVVPKQTLGDPLATGSDDLWNDLRTPVVNALHKTTNFQIGDAEVFARRVIVDVNETCRSCHIRFAKHGGNRRNNPELCVMCHNPNNTDVTRASRRGNEGVYDGKLEESKDFKHLIHSIHRSNMGLEGIQLREVVFGGPLKGWNGEAHFPGNIGNCNTCHVDDSYKLEKLPENAIGRTIRSFDWDNADFSNQGDTAFGSDNNVSDLSQHRKMSPVTSVCTSCHTDQDWFAEHIQQRGGSDMANFANMDPNGEACMACHGTGGEKDISLVHPIAAR